MLAWLNTVLGWLLDHEIISSGCQVNCLRSPRRGCCDHFLMLALISKGGYKAILTVTYDLA